MAFRRNSPGGCTNCGCTPAGGGGPITISGCSCTGMPASLSVVVSYAPGESAATYLHAYQDATLAFHTLVGGDVPAYLAPANYSGSGYYSTTTWLDDFGQENYYRFGCNVSQFPLAHGVFSPGSHSIGTVHNFNLGGANVCVPFSLTTGSPPSGVVAPSFDVIG